MSWGEEVDINVFMTFFTGNVKEIIESRWRRKKSYAMTTGCKYHFVRTSGCSENHTNVTRNI